MLSSATGGNSTTFYNDAQDLSVNVNSAVRLYISTTGLTGIGATAPKTRLQVTAGGFLNAPVLGSATGAPFYVTNSDTAYGLVIGVNSSDGRTWLQSQRTDGTATATNISLNEGGGNVGVGAAPGCKFDVFGRGRFMQDAAPTTGAVTIRQNVGDTVGGYIQWVNNAAAAEKGWLTVDTSSNMIFGPNSAEAMRITSAGNVGIGTSSPASKLDVNGTVTLRGTTFYGSSAVCNIGADATQLFLRGANIAFQDASASTTRMYLNSSGNLGIGTATPGYKLEVAGDVRVASGGDLRISAAATGNDVAMYNDNGDLYWNNGIALMYLSATGSLTATGNITAYSDARLKTDLTRIECALDKIEKLAGYTYTRTDSGERQTGLLAQDVQAVLPEAVVEGEYLSVAYGNMMGLIVEAINELRAEVKALKK